MTHDTPISLPQQTGPVGVAGLPSRAAGPRASALLAARGAGPAITSLYIHTPFCVHKCHYCDFYSFVDTRDQQAAFTDRLVAELAALAPAAHDPGGSGRRAALKSIFVGGGTPSLLAVPLWERVLAALHTHFDLSAMGRGGCGEFTVECNPESVTPELARVLVAGGVNRISMGAQSFDRRHLLTLERRHAPESVARALDIVRHAGIGRDSVDLIFGVPGQTLDQWRADLDAALAMGTTHLSCYNLTYEPNTAMTVRLKRGEFTPAGEDLEADMFTLTGQRLLDAGFARYEVSNYARPGQECRHNMVYWRHGQWLAAGPSAAGHAWVGTTPSAGGWRWKNVGNLGVYLDSGPLMPEDQTAPVGDVESPDRARSIREQLMTGLRLAEGVPAHAVLADARAVDERGAAKLLACAQQLAADGLLAEAEGDEQARWAVTDKGWLLADWIARRLMTCVP